MTRKPRGHLLWSVVPSRIGNVPPCSRRLQRIQAAAGIVREGTNQEAGMHARDVAGEAPHERAREERLERLSHVPDILAQ